ncbi:SPOR domain-containing protein [Bacillus sp. B15-48]|uniref:SPOR domain-containing protein n=1 Tax=Bacillus sp. B15-48 TaxID=1548601 RepID=UPI00193F4C7B|nr:SPOR domain-containing protein [Bacillus sp. B15-48]MBM4762440.1 hypothetical protein [Bacillus sp. B15-48]
MDKQKTITIKINGQERSNMHDKAEIESSPQKGNESTSAPKITAWNETAASKESADDHFDWVLPDPTAVDENNKKISSKPQDAKVKQKPFRLPAIKKMGNQPPFLTRILLNVALAVVVGLGFGLIILNTVTSKPQEGVQPNITPPSSEVPANSDTATGELAASSTFVVQGGVFSTKEAADRGVESLAGKGIHAQSVPSNGNYALLLATAPTLEDAKTVAAELESKGAEVFAKPYELPEKNLQNINAQESGVLTNAAELFTLLSAGISANSDSASKVETHLAQLETIAESSLENNEILALKAGLESGAKAFLANNHEGLQTANLSVIAVWQMIGE